MTTYLKVNGFHGAAAGIGMPDEFFETLDAAGIPFGAKKVDSLPVKAQEIAAQSSTKHVVIYRRSVPLAGENYDPDVPDYMKPPDEAARQHWEYHRDRLPDDLDKSVVWIETVNEVAAEFVFPREDEARAVPLFGVRSVSSRMNDDAQVEWVVDNSGWLGVFAYETAVLAMEDGYKWAAFGFSSGTPEPGHWFNAEMVEFLRLAGDNPDEIAIALHEYSYVVDDIWRGRTGQSGSYVYSLVGRFTHLIHACNELGIPPVTVLITEFGWTHDDVPDPDTAMQHIAEVGELYARYPSVKTALVWYLGSGFSGIRFKTQKLIDPLQRLLQTKIYPDPADPDPVPPPADDYDGRSRLDFSRTYVLFHANVPKTWRSETVMRAASQNLVPTVGSSADDAGLGAYFDEGDGQLRPLSRRRVVAVNPEVWGDDPHGDGTGLKAFFDFYYPGVEYVVVEATSAADCAIKVVNAILYGDDADGGFFQVYPLLNVLRAVNQGWGENSEYYDEYGMPGHGGIDLYAPMLTKVIAVGPGQVYSVTTDPTVSDYGRHVRVEHAGGWRTLYAHLERVDVAEGDNVDTGTILGLSGTSGRSTGPHLHLETRLPKGSPPYVDEHGQWPYDLYNPTRFVEPFLNDDGNGGNGTPPPQQALIGLHASADGGAGVGGSVEIAEFATLRPGVVKVMTSHSPQYITAIHRVVPSGAIWIVRPFLDWGGRAITPAQFVQWTQNDFARTIDTLLSLGVTIDRIRAELHNEPNLEPEGWLYSWQGGIEFAHWGNAVLDLMRPLYPKLRWLFPGLSPGVAVTGLRMRDMDFLNGAGALLDAVDGIAFHAYWSEGDPVANAVALAETYRRRFPDSELWVTEASYKSPADGGFVGDQYWMFIRGVSGFNVSGITFFVSSASNPEFADEVWVRGDGVSRGIAQKIRELAE